MNRKDHGCKLYTVGVPHCLKKRSEKKKDPSELDERITASDDDVDKSLSRMNRKNETKTIKK